MPLVGIDLSKTTTHSIYADKDKVTINFTSPSEYPPKPESDDIVVTFADFFGGFGNNY
jgi:hypothetical protein